MVQKIKKRLSVKALVNLLVAVVLLLLLITAIIVFKRYAQEQLYQESVNQLTEISAQLSAQLFEKLEVQLDIQWDYLAKTGDQPKTTDSMTSAQFSQFLAFRENELSPVGTQLEFVALDKNGYFYTDEGKQGIWPGLSAMTSASQQSFLVTDWITNENKMVFLRKLDNSLNVDGTEITYFAVLRSMEDMAPYFRSSAFHNQNTTYVIDHNGVKMFMDSVIPDLDFDGRNVYHTMREQLYPHIGSFDACLSESEETSFVCTDVIINDILDMSRIESGKTTLNVTSMNLADQVTQIDSILRPQADERNQTLDVVTTHLKHENVMGDPTRLNQVLVNILSNSIKYTPEGGHILFEIEELPRDGHYARYQFIVEDDGVGISKEFVKRLYDPFTRAENSVTNKVQGTGLGMAITKSIVDLMNGIIHVDSTPGKGTRFEVTLEFPIDKDAAAEVPQLSLLLFRCTPMKSLY